MRAKHPIPPKDVVEAMVVFCDTAKDSGVVMFAPKMMDHYQIRNFCLDGIRYMSQFHNRIPNRNLFSSTYDYINMICYKYLESRDDLSHLYDDQEMMSKIKIFIKTNTVKNDSPIVITPGNKNILDICEYFLDLFFVYTTRRPFETFLELVAGEQITDDEYQILQNNIFIKTLHDILTERKRPEKTPVDDIEELLKEFADKLVDDKKKDN